MIDYIEFVADNLETIIDICDHKSVKYSEYIAENLGNNYGSCGISGTCGTSGTNGTCGFSGSTGYNGRSPQKEYYQKLPILKDLELIPYGN